MTTTAATKKDDSSSEELTEITIDTVNKMQEELSKRMPQKEAKIVTDIFRKLTPETTPEDKIEGFVRVK